MATSNQANFNQNTIQIISNAMINLGALTPTDALPADDYNYALQILNMMLKSWEAQSSHLFLKSEAILFPQPNQVVYEMGVGSTDHIADTYYISESTTMPVLSGIDTIPVVSVEGMTVGDNIGVILNNTYVQWSTIASIDTGTNIVTMDDVLVDNVAAGNYVYTYTTDILRPPEVYDCRNYSVSADSSLIMINLAYDEYMQLPNKNFPGNAINWMFSPERIKAKFYLWQAPMNAQNLIKITYSKPISDLLIQGNETDFPQEWLLAITFNLSVLLGPYCGKTEKAQAMAPMAATMLKEALDFDKEQATIKFQPSWDMQAGR